MKTLAAKYAALRSIEWTTRRVVVAALAAAAFCLPFVGLGCMGLVLKLGWR